MSVNDKNNDKGKKYVTFGMFFGLIIGANVGLIIGLFTNNVGVVMPFLSIVGFVAGITIGLMMQNKYK